MPASETQSFSRFDSINCRFCIDHATWITKATHWWPALVPPALADNPVQIWRSHRTSPETHLTPSIHFPANDGHVWDKIQQKNPCPSSCAQTELPHIALQLCSLMFTTLTFITFWWKLITFH